ncbi:hypothetical protein FSP39_012340 [Pinctada imbricata]|uniref:UspA domain-containing protein n=1 Tax=Pinctada imbricata TaxID=66713 RepID=A0AA88YCP4_PINIB|nr:hypothetical protein FSP39_012340 [Pinctada imbricata]
MFSHPTAMVDVTVMTNMWKEEEARIHHLLECLGDKMKNHGIGGRVKSIGGQPGDVVCTVARDEGASLIVTGCRGLGTIRRTLMGSVSDYIIHHSHIPVLVVRHKDHHHKKGQHKE